MIEGLSHDSFVQVSDFVNMGYYVHTSPGLGEPCTAFRMPSSRNVHLPGHLYQPDLVPVDTYTNIWKSHMMVFM